MESYESGLTGASGRIDRISGQSGFSIQNGRIDADRGLAEQGLHSFRQPRCIPRGKIDKQAASLRRVPSRAEHWLRWLAVNEKKPSLPPGLKRTSGISRLGPQGDAGVLHLDILAPFSHDWHCIGMTNGTTPRSRRRHARIGSMPFAMRLSAVVSSPMWRRMAALPRRIACSTLAILLAGQGRVWLRPPLTLH